MFGIDSLPVGPEEKNRYLGHATKFVACRIESAGVSLQAAERDRTSLEVCVLFARATRRRGGRVERRSS